MTTPPGWYDDGHGAQRWWDGSGWTGHVQPVTVASPPAGESASDQARGVPPVPSAPVGVTTAPYASPFPATGVGPEAMPAAAGSKRWILWVVIGVVVLGIVAAAIAIVPRLVSFAGGSRDAVVAAVGLYDDAWQQIDWEAYREATTASFRTGFGFDEQDRFEAQARSFADATEEYVVTVTSVEQAEGAYLVETSESYNRLVDDAGAPLDEPEPIVDVYRYTVVSDSGSWRIDEIE